MGKARRRFGVFSNVTAIRRANGKVVLAGRLISGMDAHGRHWDGDLVCVCEPRPESELETNLDRTLGGDNVEVEPSELPFELVVADFESADARRALQSLDVAMVGIGYRTTHLSRWGQELDVPVVYGSEYTLKTRLQVVQAEEQNLVKRARRSAWEVNLERKQQSAIKIALGIQCNGTPTYEVYRRINPNAMLFFDGRMGEDMLVTPEVQAERHARLRRDEPLRLAWSGRLNRMKGADQLPRVAKALRALDVPFQLEIFGGGTSEAEIRSEVAALGLGDRVFVRGFVDFYRELTPHLQREVDVWVCPHPQGDPSGAYMEAFGDGLPIIGYGNEALAGMLALVDAGRTVAIDDPEALAREVASAHRDRERLVRWSTSARAYAAEHTFDKSFERRMKHVDALLAVRALRR